MDDTYVREIINQYFRGNYIHENITYSTYRRVSISQSQLPGNHGDTYGTFVFVDEGHTLGNALASVISEYPGVKICGHTVPHPAEKRVHLNIQTTGENVIKVLKRGLQDLENMCDHTLETFDKAYEKHKALQNVCVDTT